MCDLNAPKTPLGVQNWSFDKLPGYSPEKLRSRVCAVQPAVGIRGMIWRKLCSRVCAVQSFVGIRAVIWRKLCSRVCVVPILGFLLCRQPCAGRNRVLEGYFLRGGNLTSGCVLGPFFGWRGLPPILGRRIAGSYYYYYYHHSYHCYYEYYYYHYH